MKAFINGIGAVTPQETLSNDSFLKIVEGKDESFLQVLKPDYKEYINPKILRRMSKIVRISIVAAKTALADAGITIPDATITATGMGPQADTEKFLGSILNNNESLLNPTAFIQSTHNTMGAQIALIQGNSNYNITYAHRSFSFENALLDALMSINEGDVGNVLLGGMDEITEESWLIFTKTGKYKALPSHNLKILQDDQPGALAGEGATFLVLGDKKSDSTYAQITGVKSIFKQSENFEISHSIEHFIHEYGLSVDDIDLVLLGYNGDEKHDKVYLDLEDDLFVNIPIAWYKHICGEYDTSVSFTLWLAAKIIKTGTVPKILCKRGVPGSNIRNILIYNCSRNFYHSFILVNKA